MMAYGQIWYPPKHKQQAEQIPLVHHFFFLLTIPHFLSGAITGLCVCACVLGVEDWGIKTIAYSCSLPQGQHVFHKIGCPLREKGLFAWVSMCHDILYMTLILFLSLNFNLQITPRLLASSVSDRLTPHHPIGTWSQNAGYLVSKIRKMTAGPGLHLLHHQSVTLLVKKSESDLIWYRILMPPWRPQ